MTTTARQVRCPQCQEQLFWMPEAPGAISVDGEGRPLCPYDLTPLIPVGSDVPITPILDAMAILARQHAQPGELPSDVPSQPGLPLPSPPFDHQAALESIVAKNADVEQARRIYERRKADTKTAKEILDELAESLSDMIVMFQGRMAERVKAADEETETDLRIRYADEPGAGDAA